ncbi:MAG: ABC transporter permease subunit [Propionibacteriaceae bacterium]|jgi:putative aldouronate transport system permease protein|nr:ABC transporter permease subunit [Propionibacteriaceae bacterium]
MTGLSNHDSIAIASSLPPGTKTLRDGTVRLPKGYWQRDDGTIGHAKTLSTWARIRKHWRLYTFIILPLAYFLVFQYVPMVGNVIAFRKYVPGSSFPWNIIGTEWKGMTYIQQFVTNPAFWKVFTNTLIIAGLSLLFTFPLPIVLALLLNELRSGRVKRFVQTVSYLPHFLSIVLVAGLILQLTASNGLINSLLVNLHVVEAPILFMQDPAWFRPVYVISQVWQTVGWGTILYLAALTSVNDQLYEAAAIDGASRWRQTWHITLPGIRPTMIVLLVLNVGTFLGVGFEKIILIYNPATYTTGDVLSTYLYRVGLGMVPQYSLATAIGLFQSIVGLILIIGSNMISRRLTEASLW